MMNNISSEPEPEAYQYQLEIKEIWTPNLVIAKYSTNKKKIRRFSIIGSDDEDDYDKEYDLNWEELSSLKEYLNNMLLDYEDCVIFSSSNLKDILKPGDIIKIDYPYYERPYKLNENTTIFIFHAYKALYPAILAKKVKELIFDPIRDTKRPGDLLPFKMYTTLRSADVSFKKLGEIWYSLSFDDREKYYNDISAIMYDLERDYLEYIWNYFIHHFPFDNIITKEMFDKKTITKLLENLEPLRMMKKAKREDRETKYVLDVKIPKGGDAYKDFESFKEKAIISLGPDHPLIKAYFNSIKRLT
jgi:hypothetical protein